MAEELPRQVRSVPVGIGTSRGPLTHLSFPTLDDLPQGTRSPYPFPWAVEVEWTVTDGQAVPTGLRVRAMHGQPLTATALRFPVGEVIERARRATVALREIVATVDPRPTDAPAPLHAQPKRGRRPNMEHYREVARIYLEAVADGSRKPRQAVALAFGLEPTSDLAKQWIKAARRYGLIPNTGRNEDDQTKH